jgi:diguanylate cyclase (GGDEF)-like protein
MHQNIISAVDVGSAIQADERLDALLSITGRMDGFLYRCKNDASFTMLYLSDGIQTVSGYPSSDFILNHVRDYVSIIHPDDLATAMSALDDALEKRSNWNLDYRIMPLSGPPVWVREVGGGVWNDLGDLVFLEGFIIDISDRKNIEDMNARLLKDLKLANEKLSTQKQELVLAKQRSDHLANHDELTNLPNRRAFHDQLNAMIDRNQDANTAVGLMFIDLDKFKKVNDTLGHEAGDALLKKVANLLQRQLRSTDFVARLGGDEFAFVLSCNRNQAHENVLRVAERILEKLQIEIPSSKGNIRVGCTIGMAVYPAAAKDSQELLDMADRLMYIGKKDGRNRIVTVDALKAA